MKVQLPGSSMRNSKRKDDDCASEDSCGSDFDTVADEESLNRGHRADIELDSPMSPPPVYSEDQLANVDVIQYTPPTVTGSIELEPALKVCKVSPAYSKGGVSYPTCRALTCASKMRKIPSAIASASLNLSEDQILPGPSQTSVTLSSASPSEISYSVKQNRSRGSVKMCDVCHLRPRAQRAGRTYSTCGLTCAAALRNTGPNSEGNAPTLDLLTESYQNLSLSVHSSGTQQPYKQHESHGHSQSFRGSTSTQTATTCVVCLVKPCCYGGFVTCGIKCAETLCIQGSANPKMCDYCHRRPKFPGHNQCGKTCRDNASTACLLCRSRRRFGRYHLCGKTCKMIASKWTPLILEVRPGHFTYNEVERMFKCAWNGSGVPSIKKVYKIIENKSFLLPFDRYRRRVGNAVIRYHGTSWRCALGSPGITRPCPSTACAMCSILRTSFKVSLASQSGPFGAGVYTSSAANEYSNGRNGAIMLTKVVLGTVYNAKAPQEVKSCPPGYNSVVFNCQSGRFDETTVVYTNDAIRPVFLITF